MESIYKRPLFTGEQNCRSSSEFLLPALRSGELCWTQWGADRVHAVRSPHRTNITRHTAGEEFLTAQTHNFKNLLRIEITYLQSVDLKLFFLMLLLFFPFSEWEKNLSLQFCCHCYIQENAGIFLSFLLYQKKNTDWIWLKPNEQGKHCVFLNPSVISHPFEITWTNKLITFQLWRRERRSYRCVCDNPCQAWVFFTIDRFNL